MVRVSKKIRVRFIVRIRVIVRVIVRVKVRVRFSIMISVRVMVRFSIRMYGEGMDEDGWALGVGEMDSSCGEVSSSSASSR